MVDKVLICLSEIRDIPQVNYACRDAVAVLLKSLANQMRAPWIDLLVQVKRYEKDEVFNLTTHSAAKFSTPSIVIQSIASGQDKSRTSDSRVSLGVPIYQSKRVQLTGAKLACSLSAGVYIPRFFWDAVSVFERLGSSLPVKTQRVPSPWEVLVQQSVRVFVRAMLPGAAWITKTEPGISGHGDGFLHNQFHTPIPAQRLAKLSR